MPRGKRNGFLILEVLFAVLLISSTMIGLFTILRGALLTVAKTKKNSVKMTYSPLIYSAYSPMIDGSKNDSDCNMCFLELVKVDFIDKNNDKNEKKMNIENVYAGKKDIKMYDLTAVYSNAVLILPNDNEVEKVGEVAV